MRQSPLNIRSRLRARSGSAILLVMGALTVAFILGMTFLASSATSGSAARRMEDHARARQIAESGALMMIAYLQRTPDWRSVRQPGTWIDEAPFEGGTFSVVAQFGDDANEPLDLKVTARHEQASHALAVTLHVGTSSLAFTKLGLVSNHNLSLVGDARIDSFDSSKDPYGPGNQHDHAAVAMNHGMATLTGSSKILGNLWVGPDVDPETDVFAPWDAEVTGSIERLDDIVELSASEPNINESLTSPGIPSWGHTQIGSPNGPTEYYYWNELVIGGSARVTIRGPVVALVEGQVRFQHGAQINIGTHGSLTLYGRGGFDLSGDVPLNMNTADPNRLTYYGLTDAAVTIRESGRMYGRVVAPQSQAAISGSAKIHGLLLANSIELIESGRAHLDTNPALLEGMDGGYEGGQMGETEVEVMLMGWSER